MIYGARTTGGWGRGRCSLCALLFLIALGGVWNTASGFPPAPFYTVFGDVRDEFGALIYPEGAAVILSSGGREVLRQSLLDGTERGYNYQVRLRMDLQRAGTEAYSSLALGIGTTYTLSVTVDGLTYLPIEMSTPPQAGSPGGRTRINLTLGIDSDGDGLPDAWEEAQLFHSGIPPGPDGWDLSLLDGDGDFDGDGQLNRQEYISGTYATDAESQLMLEVRDVLPTSACLEFYAFYGRIYVLYSSTDLVTWVPVSLLTSNPEEDPAATASPYLRAVETGVIQIYVPHAEQGVYYRLTAR